MPDLWIAGCWLADGDVTDDRDPWCWICVNATQNFSGWLWHSLIAQCRGAYFIFCTDRWIAGWDPLCFRGLAKLKKIHTAKTNLDRAHHTHPPTHPPYQFFFWKPIFDTIYVDFIGFLIFYLKWPWTHPPTPIFFYVWNIFNFATSLTVQYL